MVDDDDGDIELVDIDTILAKQTVGTVSGIVKDMLKYVQTLAHHEKNVGLENNNGTRGTTASADLWSQLKHSKEVRSDITGIISKEKASVQKKEKNVMVFGLEKSDDEASVKEIFEVLQVTVAVDDRKLFRFKDSEEVTWDQALIPTITKKSESADEFIRTLNESFMTQNIYFKTFQKKHHERTYMTNTLDLVITEERERVYELEQGKVLGDAESGHVSISWCYGLAAGNIKGKDWETLFSGAGVQEQYEILLGEYEEKGSLDEYRVCTKNVRKSVKEAIRAYELVIISKAKDNPKLLFAYINNRQQTKESIRSIKSENGENVTDRKEIASILNRQFKSVFIVDDDKEMPEFNQRTHMVFEGDVEEMFGLN
ncbi:RNA-directed DNA polymerase from mobile element jockey-like, partial [Brachionus plicatilis]